MEKGTPITLLNKVHDILFILRSVWILVIFGIIAVLAFLALPQGADVLLCIAEDFAAIFDHEVRLMPLVCLLISLFFWSIASEYSSRLLIYIADNSGRSLPPQRVAIRRRLQRTISNIFLFFPMIVMICGFLKALVVNIQDINSTGISSAIGIIILLVLVEAFILYWLYPGNGIVRISQRSQKFRWMAISGKEAEWVKRLYGILNDVRIDIPVSNTDYQGNELPRGEMLPNGIVLPEEFQTNNANPITDNNLNVWMFKIPVRFYRCLLRQLIILSFFAVIVILTFSFVPVSAFIFVGATSLICMAFACWQLVFVALTFLDKVQSYFPFRFFLLVTFLLTTYLNNDHPVRELAEKPSASRVPLQQHFNGWLNYLKSDTNGHYRFGQTKDTLPVIFIAAEGGASRTGAFTAMMLAKLNDRFPAMRKHIYCYSGVSGGAVGQNFFNSLVINETRNANETKYGKVTKSFFATDFLASVTGRMVFAEVINYFIPWHINRFDRAIALEDAWEEGWEEMYNDGIIRRNVLKESFEENIDTTLSAVFINSTEAETGLQCVYSNVYLDGSIPLGRAKDIFRRTGKNLSYSTAINLSSRFPLISPGAAFSYGDSITRHFVDGGYYENKGAETLLEVLRALRIGTQPIKPFIIQFNFGEKDSSFKSIRSFNEIREVIGCIYNTRSGRAEVAQNQLKGYVENDLKGIFIDIDLTISTKKFPLNWTLSNTAVDRLEKLVDRTVSLQNPDDKEDNIQLRKLFVYYSKPEKEPQR